MQKVKDWFEAVELLNDRYVLKIKARTYVNYYKGRIVINDNGSRFSLSLDEFKDLYFNESFYLIEDNQVLIDRFKDEEYYAFKHK